MRDFRTDVIDDAAQARADAAELTQAKTAARKILGPTFRADGLTALEIKKAIAERTNPGLSLVGKPADYINALFDRAVARADAAPALALRTSLRPIPRQPTLGMVRTSEDARRELYERAENAWREPGNGEQS